MKQKKTFRMALCVVLGAMILCTGTLILRKIVMPDEFQSGTAETINIAESHHTPDLEKQEKYERHLEQVLADDIATYYGFSKVNMDIVYNSSEDHYTATVIILPKEETQKISADDESFIKNAIATALGNIAMDDVTIVIEDKETI